MLKKDLRKVRDTVLKNRTENLPEAVLQAFYSGDLSNFHNRQVKSKSPSNQGKIGLSNL